MADVEKGKTNSFDLMLKRANVDEDNLLNILLKEGESIELKVEYGYWKKSGNICIEVEGYGKPSGIMVTQAKIWVHALKDEATNETFYMMIEVDRLKRIIQPYLDAGKVRYLGHLNASKCVLVPIDELLHAVRGLPYNEKEKTKEVSKRSSKSTTPKPSVPPTNKT